MRPDARAASAPRCVAAAALWQAGSSCVRARLCSPDGPSGKAARTDTQRRHQPRTRCRGTTLLATCSWAHRVERRRAASLNAPSHLGEHQPRCSMHGVLG